MPRIGKTTVRIAGVSMVKHCIPSDLPEFQEDQSKRTVPSGSWISWEIGSDEFLRFDSSDRVGEINCQCSMVASSFFKECEGLSTW